MRGTVAKRLRKQDPTRPNPGRLGGGQAKLMRHIKMAEPKRKWTMRTIRKKDQT